MITPAMADLALHAIDLVVRTDWRRNGGGARPVPFVLETMAELAAIARSGAVANGPSSAVGTPLDSDASVVRPSFVDVATAATRLNVSARAVRKRAAAGTLEARKVAGVWLIEEWKDDARV